MKKLTLAILMTLTPLTYASEEAAPVGDAEAGKAKSAVCAACHGADGNSQIAMYPKIAGQHANYLKEQLEQFKSGSREDPSMSPMAAPLNEQDMLDLAAYYATQTTTVGAAREDLVELGEAIYRGGNTATGVPACGACHGQNGTGNPNSNYPTLTGQQADYVKKQLNDYKEGKRGKDSPTPLQTMMRDIAAKMTPEEMEAVASYVQGLH